MCTTFYFFLCVLRYLTNFEHVMCVYIEDLVSVYQNIIHQIYLYSLLGCPWKLVTS